MEKDTVCSVGANYAEQIDELRLVCLNATLITTPSPLYYASLIEDMLSSSLTSLVYILPSPRARVESNSCHQMEGAC